MAYISTRPPSRARSTERLAVLVQTWEFCYDAFTVLTIQIKKGSIIGCYKCLNFGFLSLKFLDVPCSLSIINFNHLQCCQELWKTNVLPFLSYRLCNGPINTAICAALDNQICVHVDQQPLYNLTFTICDLFLFSFVSFLNDLSLHSISLINTPGEYFV